jgi:hypothetical protein
MPMLAKTIEKTLEFFTIDDLVAHPLYDDFIYLNVSEKSLTQLPSKLPSRLQILVFDKNKINVLPQLPQTIRIVSGKSNKIDFITDLSHCVELETLDLYDNYIERIDNNLPSQLRVLELSFNKVKVIDYRCLPLSLVSFGLSFNFLTELPPPQWQRIMKYDHNNIEIRYRRYPGQMYKQQHIGLTQVVYNDPQNVHMHSVQESVNTSLKYILSYKCDDCDYINEIKTIYLNNQTFFAKLMSLICLNKTYGIPPFEQWCADNTIHSIYGITFNILLQHVWSIIRNHKDRHVLEKILIDELNTSIGYCFTGRFTRIINTLCGFVEEINIGVNSKEQMQNQIVMAVKKYAGDRVAQKENVKLILKEHNVEETEWSAWLEAIE